MSRNKGLANFSANFEPQIAAPLDARNLVSLLSDLTSASIWQANDGGNYTYVGMSVVVAGDPISENNGMYVLIASDYTQASSWQKQGGTTDIFHNLTPTEIEVGGIPIGSTFDSQTMAQMWDRLLYPEIFPVLTNPASTFVLTQTGLQEVGATLATLNFASTFDRGSIIPAYTTSGFRSGLPNTYVYTGAGLADNPSILLSDVQVVNNYSVAEGVQSWTGRVSYGIGEQPLSNKGNNYDTPLAASSTDIITRSITGVYPFFGTTVAIATQTKQPLAVHSAASWQLNMVAESVGNKQTAWFPDAFSAITGVRFWNTFSSTWEFVGGNAANSLLFFTVTTTQIDINGNLIDYNVYTHNGALVGARQLRFYTS